jgi:LmbE family N-acetylglucosaminyl deacetylase
VQFKNSGAELFIPDGQPQERALERTTHMAIGAHQDDLEIMACSGILECFGREDRWFLAVTVTDGSGSPRDGLYGNYSDEEMRRVRRGEQKKAAVVGEYGAVALLDYPSSSVKDPARGEVAEEIGALVDRARPQVIYTHNLADKHETHVAVALRTIQALRDLPAASRPAALYGCEVWRDLDWMTDADKVCFDLSSHENLAAALVGIFDSQICGGKRYDLATLGRRRANATYFASHGTDTASGMSFAMDLTPLIKDPGLDIERHVAEQIRRFAEGVSSALKKLGPSGG